MAKGKGTTAGRKAQYTAYRVENRAQKNKEKRLERHKRLHPNDHQAQGASASGHTRTTPVNKNGWTQRQMRGLTEFTRTDLGQGEYLPYGPYNSQRIAQGAKHWRGTLNELKYNKNVQVLLQEKE